MANSALNIPHHIAFIMDGNGRWARKRLLPRKMGHREGVKALKRIINACHERGVGEVSVFAFSTENWGRPQEEIDALFEMIKNFAESELNEYANNGFRIRFMGDIEGLPQYLKEIIKNIAKRTVNNKLITINIALNYGGQDEIVRAVNKLIDNGISVNKDTIQDALDTVGMSMPDVVVRSAGEKRLSNFMLWQAAYSELIFIDDYWPDFDAKTLNIIIQEYNMRDRRFGRVTNNA